MPTTYLFDLDDTLITNKIYATIYPAIKVLIQKKFSLNEKQFEEKAKSLGLKKNKYERFDSGDLCVKLGLTEEYYQILKEHIKIISVLKEGVHEVFDKLKREKKRIGIVSNSFQRTIKLYLEKYHLQHFVNLIFSAEDAGCKKDKEEFWKALIKKEKLNPKDCVVIGDHEVEDKEVPEKFGFRTFLIENEDDLKRVVNQSFHFVGEV